MDLKLLQQYEYNLLNLVIKICDEEHINYWLTGGSMVGAVKYAGIVPWDDDLDIGMLRPDLEQFIQAVQERFGQDSRYEILSDMTHADYGITWCKLIDKQTQIEEDYPFSSRTVFLDIVPYDAVPNSAIGRTLKKVSFHLLDRLVHSRYINLYIDNRLGKLLYGLLTTILSVIPTLTLKAMRHYVMTSSHSSKTRVYGNYASWFDWGHEWATADELASFKSVPFGDGQARIPVGANSILKRMYGDITQDPALADQHPDHVKSFHVLNHISSTEIVVQPAVIRHELSSVKE